MSPRCCSGRMVCPCDPQAPVAAALPCNGLTHWQSNDPSVDVQIERSDRALYAAKSRGRDRIEVIID